MNPLVITVIQKNGTDISLQQDLKAVLQEIFSLCGITTGNFTANILAPSNNALPVRTIHVRTVEERAIYARANGDRTRTWNISISGPNNRGVFDAISKKSSKRQFQYDEDHKIMSGFDVVTSPTVTSPVIPSLSLIPTITPSIEATVPTGPKERFSLTKNPENLVFALGCIAEAGDADGNISFIKICEVINTNFGEGGSISEAKIRGGCTSPLIAKNYIRSTNKFPAKYTLTEAAITLLETNNMITPEVKARYEVKVTMRALGTSTATPVPSFQSGTLETKLVELQAQIGRHAELQVQGAALVEKRNMLLIRRQTLERELAGIPEELRRVETEIGEITKAVADLSTAKQRYDQIMKLLEP